MTPHFRDRHSIEITVVMCDREALYIGYCFCAGAKAIQYGVNITSVCFILLMLTQTWLSLIKGRGRGQGAGGRRPGAGGWGPGARGRWPGAKGWQPGISPGYLYNDHNLKLL